MILYKKKQSYFEYFINKWSIDVTSFILKIRIFIYKLNKFFKSSRIKYKRIKISRIMNQPHITYMGSGVNNFNFLNLECEIRFLIERSF